MNSKPAPNWVDTIYCEGKNFCKFCLTVQGRRHIRRDYSITEELVCPLLEEEEIMACKTCGHKVDSSSRKGCKDCARKHLAQVWILHEQFRQGYQSVYDLLCRANILIEESKQGHPLNLWLAVGCIAEAGYQTGDEQLRDIRHEQGKMVPIELIETLKNLPTREYTREEIYQRMIGNLREAASEINAYSREIRQQINVVRSGLEGREVNLRIDVEDMIKRIGELK